ncbi:MAG: ribonucleotide reductase N-terminal alpha domain-containing protein, partial [Calditrichaceae bacterium]
MFLDIFKHKGKFVNLCGKKNLKNYQNLYLILKKKQNNAEVPIHPENNYLGDNELAKNIFEKKYFVKDLNNDLIEKTPEDLFVRVSSFIASIEPDPAKAEECAVQFYKYLYEGYFVPGGRVLAGAGDLYRLKTLSNCFVTQIESDNIESIYNSAYECARTYSYGGGIGVDISPLRPKDSIVHNAADSSTGAVSFMELFSLTTGLIGQSGRRGALMLTIDVKHPDVVEFIRVKKIPNWVTDQIIEQLKWSNQFDEDQLKEVKKQVMENTQVRFANISIKVSDEFMQAVDEQNTYGKNKILVYKKFNKKVLNKALQDVDCHYSYQIPANDIDEYELFHVFEKISGLNDYLYKNYELILTEEDMNNAFKRDVYGDVVLSLENEPFDLAIRYSGDFMLYFASEPTNEIRKLQKAREIWDAFVEGNYRTAEPGLIFWSRMSKYSPSNYVDRPISSTNPCAEVPLEKGGACNLASINLSRIVRNGFTKNAELDWATLRKVTESTVRFLDNVVSWNELLNPLEKQRTAAAETRRLGLGTMGAADMLNQLGIAYDSTEGIELVEKVMETVCNSAYRASAKLAAEKGSSPIFNFDKYAHGPFFKEALNPETKDLIKKNGLRNIAILAIAPTGSISNIVLSFVNGNRNLNNQVEHAQTEAELTESLPNYFFRTAHHVDADRRVEIQGRCQKYIDHSISSTVNLKETIEPEVISAIYLNAWKKGLKGITVYRDGSRYPILSVESDKTDFQRMREKTFKLMLANSSEEVTLKGDDIIVTPDERLTTVYHYIKEKDIKV